VQVRFNVPPTHTGLLLPAVGGVIDPPPATVTVFVTTQPKAVLVIVTVYVPAGSPLAVFAPGAPEVLETVVPPEFVHT
jgi:hypothetical protein